MTADTQPLVYTTARRRCPVTASPDSYIEQADPEHGRCTQPDCDGGYISVPVTEPCGKCEGGLQSSHRGVWSRPEMDEFDYRPPSAFRDCPVCDGTGEVTPDWAWVYVGDLALTPDGMAAIVVGIDGTRGIIRLYSGGEFPARPSDLALDLDALVAGGQRHRPTSAQVIGTQL